MPPIEYDLAMTELRYAQRHDTAVRAQMDTVVDAHLKRLVSQPSMAEPPARAELYPHHGSPELTETLPESLRWLVEFHYGQALEFQGALLHSADAAELPNRLKPLLYTASSGAVVVMPPIDGVHSTRTNELSAALRKKVDALASPGTARDDAGLLINYLTLLDSIRADLIEHWPKDAQRRHVSPTRF